MFLEVDTDHSGMISNSELEEMPLFKKYFTPEECEKIYLDYDLDGGELNFIEFANMMCPNGYVVKEEVAHRLHY